MSIEKELEDIHRFLTSKDCVFSLTPLDYPNEIQQACIKSYLLVRKILDQKEPLRTFQEMSFKNVTNQKSIVIGLFYNSLLIRESQEEMFEYTRQLRSEALQFYGSFFMQFAVQEFSRVSDEGILAMPAIYFQLMRFNILADKTTVAMLRTINFTDLSERGLTYCNSLVDVLMQILKFIDAKGVGRLIFIKMLRVLTPLVSINDQEIIEFKDKCKRLLVHLWGLNDEECLDCGKEAFRYFQELISIPEMKDLFNEYRVRYYSKEKAILMLPKLNYDQLLAVNIPIEVFEVIVFSLSGDSKQIYYQLSWLERRNKDNRYFEMLLVDILRYMVRIVHHANRFVFIEWILGYCMSNKCTPICLPLCQQALFFDWFFYEILDENKILELTFAGLFILNQLNHMHSTRCQQMMEFIIRQQLVAFDGSPKVKDNLRRTLLISEQKGPFKYSQFLANTKIDPLLKTELQQLLSEVRKENPEYEVQAPPADLTQTDDIWGHQVYVEEEKIAQRQDQQEGVYIRLEKLFYESCKSGINLITQSPTKENYALFLDELISVCKKVFKDPETYNKFILEAVKVTYILFQSHFECFWKLPPESNIINISIEVLMRLWIVSDITLQVHKKLLRGLMQWFPVCVYSVNYVFLMSVAPTRVHCREVGVFLQNKQKEALERVMLRLVDDPDTQVSMQSKASKYKLMMQ